MSKKFGRYIAKTMETPVTPPAGFTELFFDSANDGKLTVVREDGVKNVLDAIEGAYFSATITSWTENNSLYYADVTHNMGTLDIMPHAYLANGKSVQVEEFERINLNTLRVWVASNTENVNIIIFQAGTLAGIELQKLIGVLNASLNGIPYASADKTEVFSELNAAKTLKSNKDVNGIYTTIEWSDASNTVRKRSVLSGGTSPEYTTRTETFYNASGSLIYTKSYTQAYDLAGEWIGETVV